MPLGAHIPPWRRVLEQHTTWRLWTAACPVEWLADGVRVQRVAAPPPVPFAVQSQGAPLAPPMRFWRLVRYALPQWRVTLVPSTDATTVQLQIVEDSRYGRIHR